jgi:hypothetical protein
MLSFYSAFSSDSGTIVSLEFKFRETGEIIRVFATERFRQIDGDPPVS